MNGIQEVRGSIPLVSTRNHAGLRIFADPLFYVFHSTLKNSIAFLPIKKKREKMNSGRCIFKDTPAGVFYFLISVFTNLGNRFTVLFYKFIPCVGYHFFKFRHRDVTGLLHRRGLCFQIYVNGGDPVHFCQRVVYVFLAVSAHHTFYF